MSREEGFAIGDLDTSYFEDAKLRDLWRRVRDEDAMARAVCIHLSTLLASWRHGEAVTVAQGAPLWLNDDADLIAHLQACHLLDDTQRVVSFDEWYGAAHARRETRRTNGRAGGLASGRARSTQAEATVEPSVQQGSSVAEPDRPSVRPSVPTVPPVAGAREGLPNLNSAVAKVWEDATGITVLGSGEFAIRYLDDACRRHPASEVGAAIIRARRTFEHIPAAQPLIVAVRAILDPLGDGKAAVKAVDTEKRRAATRVQTLHQRHAAGYHIDAPDPDCSKCQEGAA
ncbi:MAG: hypothetical protein WAV64_01930 [Candidatus Moraniibacteriota bacterium]